MHTSFQTVLSRTFRQQPSAASAGYSTVAAWLAPAATAAARPPRRQFSQTRRRRAQPLDAPHESSHVSQPLPSIPKRLRVPGPAREHSVEAWVERLEPWLPPHLSSSPVHAPVIPSTGPERTDYIRSIVWFVAQSWKHRGVDILSYLALEQGRWDVVKWLVGTVVESSARRKGRLEDLVVFDTVKWDGGHGSLQEATNEPIAAQKIGTSPPFQQTIVQLTDFEEILTDGSTHRKSALGIVWRSLGNMILTAVGDRPQDKDTIMANVLEILAHLHHSGIIPESVYHYEPPKDSHSLQQPPTLYLLSSRIMTALSDAAWRAHESAVASAHKSNAQYTFLGHEIPGSRYKVRTPELGSEVWLELVLWSCLHGGWAIDGATILEKLRNYKGNSRWSVLSWRNILQDQDGSSFRNMTWTDIWSFARARGTQANSPDRFVVERTVSSEVIAAFIDRFLNLVDTGVGSRGLPFLDVYKFVTNLKDLLNRENLGLGSATWESVLVRFLESGAFDFNTEARLVSKMLYFTSKYDREHDYHNAPQKDENNPGSHSYILEPSAISLGILHQTLRIHINDGNLRAAARVTWQLHALTDENKKRSIQRFFEKLNRPSDNYSTPQESFSSNTSHFHYPAYSPQIPIPLLAGLLRLATKSQEYDFARKLLYSDNYDGPLIPYELYSRSAIAAALIEYAVAADDRPLIARLVESHQNKPGMSLRVSEVMMENQMRINNWDSVEKIIYALASKNEGALAANAGALIAKHLLILQGAQAKSTKEVTEHDPIAKAASMLRRLAKAKFGNSDRERLNRFHGILCVLLSVGSEWHGFCSKLIFYHGTRKLEISLLEQDFAQLLQGVTESRGAYAGMQLMVKWCKDVSHARPLEPQSHRLESSRSEYVLRFANLDVEKVSVTKADGSKLVLRGQRLQPRLPLMRTVYRAALASLENGSESPFAWRAERTQEVLEWALRGLEAMGLSRRDIGYELRGIYSLKILNRKVKRAEKRIRRKEEKAKELAEGHEPPQESEGEEHDDLD